VEQRIGHPVIKAFNNIYARHLLELGKPAGAAERIALPVAGDDAAAKTMPATNTATPTIFSPSPGLTLATASTMHALPSNHLDRWCIARIAPFSSRGVIRSSESTIKPNRATATAAVSQENFASGLIRRPP
jgi:hypothetical protein